MRMNDLVAWREYAPGGGYSTAQHVEKFKELTKQNENPPYYNVVKKVGGNQTTEDEIRQGYGSHGWSIQAPQITKVNAQLDRVLGLVELNKFYIFSDMTQILTQISNCMWELSEDNKPLNKIKNEAQYHLLACLRYIGSEFVPETVLNRPLGMSYGI
jgi:hypothetical protein